MIRNIRNKIRKNRGFTLVELMIVVAIVGILAALAIYGVTRYMKNAKTAEARNSIGQIAKDAAAAYSREKMAPGVMAAKDVTAVANTICKSASKAVPEDITKVKAQKYQSGPDEWAPKDEAMDVGWTCLKFSMDQPQYYQYNYTATATDPLSDSFDAVAKGDLDGDEEVSTFTLAGAVQNGTVAISPAIKEENAEE
jgi:type IV pilus assembly protein PilA